MSTNAKKWANIPFNLQLFAGEKTEPATEKRREEARQQGNVLKSHDLESIIVLISAFVTLYFYGSQMIAIVSDFMRFTLTHVIFTELSITTTITLFGQLTIIFFKCLTPLFIIIILTAVAANLMQVGFLLTFEPLTPDFNRLNPFSGLENLFSWKAIGELVKSIFKVVIVAYIPYSTLTNQMPILIRFIQLEPIQAMIFLGKILFTMIFKILALLLILGFGDYWFQWWRYEESLKMSKEEIKEEFKQREGDPKVKAKIRERQRKLASRRMLEEVPKATVVVTNPIHIAVAIMYEKFSSIPPKVVAMGTELIAEKIKEIAKEHGVPIIENKPLAQMLYKMVDVGDEIPVELWEAVAEILARVYTMERKAA